MGTRNPELLHVPRHICREVSCCSLQTAVIQWYCWNQLAALHRMQQNTASTLLTGESGVRLHVSLSEGYHQRQNILKLMSTILILQIKK